MIMRKVGFSTCGAKDLSPAALASYREAGICCLEYSFATEKYADFDFTKAAAEARAADIEPWSVHLPFLPFETNNIAALDPAVLRHTVEYLSDFIRRTADAGMHTVVIHPSGEPNAPETRQEQMKNAKECLAKLAEIAAREGVVVAVEDLPRTCLGNCSFEILDLISVDPRLKVCFDTNHLLDEDIVAFIRATGKHIHTVHISDYDFIDERHWLPGEGKIDWRSVMDALDEVGYNGPHLYELGFKAPKTLERPRDLTAADFVRNAQELMARASLTVIGKSLL